MKTVKYVALLLFALLSAVAYSQSFGFDEPEDDANAPWLSADAGGEITLEFPFYFNNYQFLWEELARAKINFSLSSKHMEAITAFNLSYNSIKEIFEPGAVDYSYTPLIIDEAFLRFFAGPVNIEAGFRKLSWGRADGSGPLDVTNPVDYTDLRHITDLRARKIARPMLHVTWNAGSFSKLEGVFIPNFSGHRFTLDGRWAPSQFYKMPDLVIDEIKSDIAPLIPQPAQSDFFNAFDNMTAGISNFSLKYPDTQAIENFQAGLRFTTTIGQADIGAQYFYGNLFRPSVTVNGIKDFAKDLSYGMFNGFPPNINFTYAPKIDLIEPQIIYTRFHQIGFDYAQVLFTLNARAELALNLTEDWDGSDGARHNPFIAWSFGFDRDLFWGINLNLQCNETIRLFNENVKDNPIYDSEAGTSATNTRLTAQLSKKFFRDDLEAKATVIWDIENIDCYLLPSVIYTLGNNFKFDLTAGFFLGNEGGELGQYWENSFIRIGASFMF